MPVNLPRLFYSGHRDRRNRSIRSLQYPILRWRRPDDAVLGILDLDSSRLFDCDFWHNAQSMVYFGGERTSAMERGTWDTSLSHCSPWTCLAELC